MDLRPEQNAGRLAPADAKCGSLPATKKLSGLINTDGSGDRPPKLALPSQDSNRLRPAFRAGGTQREAIIGIAARISSPILASGDR